MLSRIVTRSVGLVAMLSLPQLACSHDPKPHDPSAQSMTDEAGSAPERPIPPAPPTPMPGPKKHHPPHLRTEEAAREAANTQDPNKDDVYAKAVDAAVAPTTPPPLPKDNSRVNRVNNGEVGLTAEQQGSSRSDVELTRKIRKAVTDDKALSVYAHNVKIITRDGKVVLKGPVRSEGEREIVEAHAAKIAGAPQVTSSLEVEPK